LVQVAGQAEQVDSLRLVVGLVEHVVLQQDHPAQVALGLPE
jgi:hypothetical protein